MKDIVIVGHGGFAKEVAWLLGRINAVSSTWNMIGYITDGDRTEDVIGNDEFLWNCSRNLAVLIGIGDCMTRKRLAEKYQCNSNLFFPTIIDPDAIVPWGVDLGIGNIICANTVMTVDIKIGNFNIVNLACTIGHGARIGDFVTINPSVNLSGDVIVDSLVNIGTGTQVIQGKRIGTGSVVGAGAVVNKDLPTECVAYGVPAKVRNA